MPKERTREYIEEIVRAFKGKKVDRFHRLSKVFSDYTELGKDDYYKIDCSAVVEMLMVMENEIDGKETTK